MHSTCCSSHHSPKPQQVASRRQQGLSVMLQWTGMLARGLCSDVACSVNALSRPGVLDSSGGNTTTYDHLKCKRLSLSALHPILWCPSVNVAAVAVSGRRTVWMLVPEACCWLPRPAQLLPHCVLTWWHTTCRSGKRGAGLCLCGRVIISTWCQCFCCAT